LAFKNYRPGQKPPQAKHRAWLGPAIFGLAWPGFWPQAGAGTSLVVVDQGLSKGVILVPCNKTLTSEDTARLLLENLYKRFGLPDRIISDRGPQFASKVFLELLKLLGIKSALSTAYHPQTDGTTERVNQEIEAYLSIYCASHPEEWPQALHTMEFTHNNRRHADRPQTPFELMFGESPVAIPFRTAVFYGLFPLHYGRRPCLHFRATVRQDGSSGG
jgi:transposase InsO family protein